MGMGQDSADWQFYSGSPISFTQGVQGTLTGFSGQFFHILKLNCFDSWLLCVFALLTLEPLCEKTCLLHVCENKGADQQHGKHATDQRLRFSNKDSATLLLLKSKISSL